MDGPHTWPMVIFVRRLAISLSGGFVKVSDMSDWAIHLFVLGLGISVMLGLSRALRRVARRRSLTQDDVVLVDSGVSEFLCVRLDQSHPPLGKRL